jgi:hypothetical protein
LRICHSRAWLPREAAFFAVLSAAKELGRAETLHFVQGGRKRPSRIPRAYSAVKSRHSRLVDSIKAIFVRRAICLISLSRLIAWLISLNSSK